MKNPATRPSLMGQVNGNRPKWQPKRYPVSAVIYRTNKITKKDYGFKYNSEIDERDMVKFPGSNTFDLKTTVKLWLNRNSLPESNVNVHIDLKNPIL